MTVDADVADYRESLSQLIYQAPVDTPRQVAPDRAQHLQRAQRLSDQVEWTVADDEAVRGLVRECMFDTDGEVWAALTSDSHRIAATTRALVGLKSELQRQFGFRREETETFRQDCLRRGPGGRKAWVEAKREYDSWKRRALFVDQRVALLIRYLKDRRAVVNRAATSVADQRAWEQLAKAIATHEASDAPDRDTTLYAALDAVEVRGEPIRTKLAHFWW